MTYIMYWAAQPLPPRSSHPKAAQKDTWVSPVPFRRKAHCSRPYGTKGNPKEIVTDEKIISKQCALIETVHTMGAEVLLSCHPGIFMTADQVVDLALFFEKRNPDIIKIVTTAANEDELTESIRAMLLLKKEVKTPVAYHASGKAGMLSRIVNPILGGQIAFCVDRYTETSVMEQLELRTAATVVENIRKITEA